MIGRAYIQGVDPDGIILVVGGVLADDERVVALHHANVVCKHSGTGSAGCD